MHKANSPPKERDRPFACIGRFIRVSRNATVARSATKIGWRRGRMSKGEYDIVGEVVDGGW